MRLGLFLHSPFPSSEVFRTFPRRDELLRSLLNADLIGGHLLAACTRVACMTSVSMCCTSIKQAGKAWTVVSIVSKRFPLG